MKNPIHPNEPFHPAGQPVVVMRQTPAVEIPGTAETFSPGIADAFVEQLEGSPRLANRFLRALLAGLKV
jgi:hypothetical protein